MNAQVTRRELAQRMDVVMGTITKWEIAGMPVAAPGRKGKPSLYDEKTVREWLASREAKARENGSADLPRERARKEKAQAILAEQTYQMRAVELVPAHEVEKAWAAEVSAVRAKMLSWPAAVADRIYREAISVRGLAGVVHALEESVAEALEELSSPKGRPSGSRRKTPATQSKRKK